MNSKMFTFNGQSFATYQEMVNPKRQRNHDKLKSLGLLAAKMFIASTSAATAATITVFNNSSHKECMELDDKDVV